MAHPFGGSGFRRATCLFPDCDKKVSRLKCTADGAGDIYDEFCENHDYEKYHAELERQRILAKVEAEMRKG